MPELTLPSGHVVLYDECDQWIVDKYKWHKSERGYVRAQVRNKGKVKNYSFHHLIIDCPKGMERDHINGNRLDNRRMNLRIVTTQQNSWNSKKYKNNTTGYKGVSRSGNSYVALIRVDGKRKYIGASKDVVKAAKMYDKAAKKYFGEFARLNFPDSTEESYPTPQ